MSAAKVPMSDLDMQRHLTRQQQMHNGKFSSPKPRKDLYIYLSHCIILNRWPEQPIDGVIILVKLGDHTGRESVPNLDEATTKLATTSASPK